MTGSAIIMMLVAMLVLWGGLVLAEVIRIQGDTVAMSDVAWIDVRWDITGREDRSHKVSISMMAVNRPGSLAQTTGTFPPRFTVAPPRPVPGPTVASLAPSVTLPGYSVARSRSCR